MIQVIYEFEIELGESEKFFKIKKRSPQFVVIGNFLREYNLS